MEDRKKNKGGMKCEGDWGKKGGSGMEKNREREKGKKVIEPRIELGTFSVLD